MILPRCSHILLIVCFAVSISGCDNSLEPIDEETGIFAIYGFLDLNKQNHYIRVRDLNVPFTREATETIDATVTLHNLTLGTSTLLESEHRAHQDVYQHNFLVSGTIQPNAEYNLTVKRSDGVSVEVQAVMPTKPEPVITPSNPNCFTPVEVELNPLQGGVLVYTIGVNLGSPSPRFTAERIIRTSGDQPGKISFTFTLAEVVDEVRFFNTPACEELNLDHYMINYRHFGPGFYEKLENDPFDILQSTERFGGYYRVSLVLPMNNQ